MRVRSCTWNNQIRPSLQIRVDIFCDDEPSPHHLPMLGIGTEEFVIAFLCRCSQLQSFALPGVKQLRSRKNIWAVWENCTTLAVELARLDLRRVHGHALATVGLHDEQVVRHEIGVLEGDFEWLARFNDEPR